jgi:CubicO group peptidase (beta-lactamase class C family)
MSRKQQAASAQAEVEQLVGRAIDEGAERAAQVAVYLDGERVVDVSLGSPDCPVGERSLFPFFSVGKGIATTAVLRLVERGVLSLDEPICRYWREFAAEGKEAITLRHVMGHVAGMAMMPEWGDAELVADWEAMCAYLAAAKATYAPGQGEHYHAITFSWLVGETARRADGRDFARIVEEEVLRPIGVVDLYFGVPDDRLADCVAVQPALPSPPGEPTPAPAPPDPVAARAIPPWVCPLEQWMGDRRIRQACIPASNGFGTADAIARQYAALVGTGIDGVRLLSDATLDDATVPVGSGWGTGYGLRGPEEARGAAFGHGGYGGAVGLADRRFGLAVGVVKSQMGGPLTDEILAVVGRCLHCA